MSETDQVKPAQQNDNANEAISAAKPKKKSMNEKLRKKLEKLKKDDPNIYPVF